MQASQWFQNPLNQPVDRTPESCIGDPPSRPYSGHVLGIGIDVTPISRIARLVSRYDQETLTLIFTSSEIDRCQSASYPYRYYAACFSAKEAVGKALGTGLAGINWYEIEASVTDTKLTIDLLGGACHQASKRGIKEWLATWCYWDDYVLVHVLAQ